MKLRSKPKMDPKWPRPLPKIVGIVMPMRKDVVGIVYMKKDKIYLAERKSPSDENYNHYRFSELQDDLQDDSNDHLIESLDDIKKAFTKKKLRGTAP